MEIKNKLTVIRGEGREGQQGKEGEGSSQGTWTRTRGHRLSLGASVGQGRGEQWKEWILL